MKNITRRGFLKIAGLIIAGLGWIKSERVPDSWLHTLVQAEGVAVFSAPFLVPQLKSGQHLEVFWRHGKACLALDEHLLGWLPASAERIYKQRVVQGQLPKVQVERTDRTEQGRLILLVKVF